MKRMTNNLFAAVILGVALAGVALAQAPSKGSAVKTEKARMAVVEFTPGPNASGMTAEAKRQLQASIAFRLMKTNRVHVVDVRHTRDASQADLVAVNGASTAAAVRIGKQLGVSYVLTGTVDEYNPNGSATLKTRLVEVATGKVKHADETSQQSTSAMTTGGDAEMKTKVLLPLILKLTATLTEVVL
jgi:TolB-like protein